MLKIKIKTIPNRKQRYPTAGDWYDDGNTHEIRVSELSNPKYELLIAVHELIESELCRQRGISEEAVTRFDRWFEEARNLGLLYNDDEPGFHPNAPYKNEHTFATMIERQLAKELGVDWESYAREIEKL